MISRVSKGTFCIRFTAGWLATLALTIFLGSQHVMAKHVTSVKPITSLDEAVIWLQAKSKEMIRDSRVMMNNNVAAFPHQVGAGYGAFWLRDYASSSTW